jgi:hypothetical protein
MDAGCPGPPNAMASAARQELTSREQTAKRTKVLMGVAVKK